MKKIKHALVLLFPLFFNQPVFAQNSWQQMQLQSSWAEIQNHLMRADVTRGSVIASPSKTNPNYFYHWVRDAALVMDVWIQKRETLPAGNTKNWIDNRLKDYLIFSRKIQKTSNPSGTPNTRGIGEPKFHVDGSVYTDSWGRPQDDGPALRAFSLIRLSSQWVKDGKLEEIKKWILPLVFDDLDYIARVYHLPSFDPWEEVMGFHFYNQMTQRRAMVEGVWFAKFFSQPEKAKIYEKVANRLTKECQQYYSRSRKYIEATKAPKTNPSFKPSELDVQTILAVLHTASVRDPFFPVSHPAVFQTVQELEKRFSDLYRVNQIKKNEIGEKLGIAIGRYPEDRYNGYHTSGRGNPWFLATLALSEYYFRLAQVEKDAIRKALWHEKAEEYLHRVEFHAPRKGDLQFGKLSEQYDRMHGVMTGAERLTWSYAAYITAQREKMKATRLE